MIVISEAGKKYEYDEKKYRDPNRKDGRRNPGRKSWQVGELWDVHHEIARLLLIGWRGVDIAKKLNCSAAMVSNVRNSPVIQDKLAIMRGARDADTIDLSREIRKVAPTALELLRNVIDGEVDGEKPSLPLRAKTAESMMDRAGYAPPKRIQSESVSYTLTPEEIEVLKNKAVGNDDVVDGEYEEDK